MPDERCYYVLTLRGDLGPFDRTTLLEQLHGGAVQATDQVRNAFGRAQGTVGETLGIPRDRPSGALRRTAPGKASDSGRTGSGRTAARGSQTGRRVPPPPPSRRQLLPVLVIAGALLLLLVVATASSGSRPAEEAARPPSAPMAPKPSGSAGAAMAPAPVAGTAQPRPAAPRLVIIRAFYGVLPNGPGKDVTAIVKSAVLDDRLSFMVDNARFGDPAFGVHKDLNVVYTWDGHERSAIVSESAQLTLPGQGR